MRRLLTHLPGGWATERESQGGDKELDVVLRAPDGASAILAIQAKSLIETRDVPFMLEKLRDSRQQGSVPLLAARYLAPTTRDRIASEGAAYADATGNLRIALDSPALFLRDVGAERDPWRGPGRPRGTLKGPPAARVVRALADFRPPFTVPELAKKAKTSTGATYRVVEFVEDEGLLEREYRGPVTEVRWRPLLERWADDYGFERSNVVGTFLEPRGLPALIHRLRDLDDADYVVTGSLAAQPFSDYAPPRAGALYVPESQGLAVSLELRPVRSGANVLVATTRYDAVFERSVMHEGLRLTAPSQTAVDLLTGPGRNPSEAMALLDWMERNEQSWRR